MFIKLPPDPLGSDKTINQLANEHQLHPSQIGQRKKQLLEQRSDIFMTTPTKRQREQNDREVQSVRADWKKSYLLSEY